MFKEAEITGTSAVAKITSVVGETTFVVAEITLEGL